MHRGACSGARGILLADACSIPTPDSRPQSAVPLVGSAGILDRLCETKCVTASQNWCALERFTIQLLTEFFSDTFGVIFIKS